MSQIYLLEVFIWKLNLLPHIVEACGDAVHIIRIDFIDFSTLEITRNDSSFAFVAPPTCERNLDFNSGQACHFAIKPQDLVKAMMSKPLKISVYLSGESFPMCFAELPMSGCLCDQVTMTVGGEHLPSPYVFCRDFLLMEHSGDSAGSLDLMIRLTCFGNCLVTHYVLQNEHFLFKNDLNGAEYKCHQVAKPRVSCKARSKTDDPKGLWMMGCEGHLTDKHSNVVKDFCGVELKLPMEDFMRDIAGISLAAKHLSLGKSPPKLPRSPLFHQPETPPVKKKKEKK